jgi:cysteine sulfinate desulfinase/cysteine desulfurase-like protein
MYFILIHPKASQSIGKLNCNVNELGVDLLTICSHKFYGPKGYSFYKNIKKVLEHYLLKMVLNYKN